MKIFLKVLIKSENNVEEFWFVATNGKILNSLLYNKSGFRVLSLLLPLLLTLVAASMASLYQKIAFLIGVTSVGSFISQVKNITMTIIKYKQT